MALRHCGLLRHLPSHPCPTSSRLPPDCPHRRGGEGARVRRVHLPHAPPGDLAKLRGLREELALLEVVAAAAAEAGDEDGEAECVSLRAMIEKESELDGLLKEHAATYRRRHRKTVGR